ncbi:MAG TPA: hypothetical protein ACQGQI_03725 [Xylella sp.]
MVEAVVCDLQAKGEQCLALLMCRADGLQHVVELGRGLLDVRCLCTDVGRVFKYSYVMVTVLAQRLGI